MLVASAVLAVAVLAVRGRRPRRGRGPAHSGHRGHRPRAGDVVSFTFDDGPNPPDTLRLLQVLRGHHVRAVFCLWGDFVRDHPEVVRRIARQGHVLCNHSMHHDDMSALTPAEIRADLEATSALIRQAVPHARIAYFRAPFGSWGAEPAGRRRPGHATAGLATGHRGLGAARHRRAGAAAARPHHPGRGGAACTTAAATAARPSRR